MNACPPIIFNVLPLTKIVTPSPLSIIFRYSSCTPSNLRTRSCDSKCTVSSLGLTFFIIIFWRAMEVFWQLVVAVLHRLHPILPEQRIPASLPFCQSRLEKSLHTDQG